MKYRTFLDILFFIALLSAVIIMTANNVEAASDDYYNISVEIDTLITYVNYISANDAFSFVNINGIRIITIHCISEYYGYEPYSLASSEISELYTFILNFSVPYRIDNITISGVNGYDIIDVVTDIIPYRLEHLNASFRIYKNNALIASGYGLGTHIINLPCPSIPLPSPPIELPPPIFELPPSPVLTPPATRPAFFNFTSLIPFFEYVDSLFLPIAQIIIDIIWIPLSILDFINQILVDFWSFFDTHVLYGGFLNVLGFLRMFFEIPEVMMLMIFGLSLVVIKIYLKR